MEMVLCLYLNPVDIYSASRRTRWMQEQPFENWIVPGVLNYFLDHFKSFQINLTNNFSKPLSSLIGLLFWGKIGYFPGLGNVTTSACILLKRLICQKQFCFKSYPAAGQADPEYIKRARPEVLHCGCLLGYNQSLRFYVACSTNI